MITKEQILDENIEKYGEWIEEAGSNAPSLVVHILCVMLAQEREKNEFHKRFKNVSVITTNS